MFHVLSLLPGIGDLEGVAAGVAEDEDAIRGQERGKMFVIKEFLGEGFAAFVDVLLAKGWVGHDEVKLLAVLRHAREGVKNVFDADVESARRESAGLHVVLNKSRMFAG